ncbi:uncharacterized protein FOMMEDRAFT_27121 [Fomitiporia mediterranea MF3/22]|uniref:uncharacterized protein n=1 Tax=Fomitiporia mediterranea (strain MF3/22) TaxID=694068 RepID=UPI000440820F|nr:uncharacterized protein FOMMEDRAFT_27121 [Fomitiporia mediterranea MF3/22]EJD04812.1 hypothetical protein FOMMEDRAFT_27121 [Fomitiporia mediterranea MF3/22]
MASTSTSTNLALTVIRASDVKWQSAFRSKLPNLYVQIEVNNDRRQTQTIKKALAPEWNESFSFTHLSIGQGTEFKLRLKHDSSRWGDKCLGKVDVELDDLLNRYAGDKEAELRLKLPSDSATSETAAVLHLRLEAVDEMTSVGRNVDTTKHVVQKNSISSSAVASDSIVLEMVKAGEDHVAAYTDLYQSVGELVSKLDIFIDIIDKLSEDECLR